MSTTTDDVTRHRVLPLLTVAVAEHADAVAEALVTAALPVLEVALRTPASLEAIRRISGRSDLLVGAGTVLTPAQVDAVVRAGARFVVSPGTSRAVLERCAELGLPAIPGAVTATEVMAALDLGIDL
ncbi:MAG: keto-deoxy-phosphogluconate aldolase, partial [Nocardioides sp.]